MAKTDRQTDTKVRSTCWLTTCYNDDIDIIENKSSWPDVVKEVYGGREKCPDTGRLHFQGAIILHSQQRLSRLKEWLPTAWFGAAKSSEAVKKYAMKNETAVGPKEVRVNTVPYLKLHDKMMCLADAMDRFNILDIDKMRMYEEKNPKDGEFWYLVTEKVLPALGPEIIGAFADPEVRTVWRNTRLYWLAQPAKSPLSITEATDTMSEANSFPAQPDAGEAGIQNVCIEYKDGCQVYSQGES